MEHNTSQILAEPTAAPLATTNGAGSALFVINLCASMAPLALAGKSLPGLESYRLYQVARAEDGRTRHRLRLGFFLSEADAETTLALVRDQYPTAFTTCLAAEDRKFARGFVPENVPTAAAAKPQISVVVDNDSTRPLRILQPSLTPSAKPAASAATQAPMAAASGSPIKPPAAKSVALELAKTTEPLPAPTQGHRGIVATKAASSEAFDLTLATESAAAPAGIPARPASEPFHVGKGIELPATGLTLDTEKQAEAARLAPAAPALRARESATERFHAPAARPTEPTATAKPAKPASSSLSQAELDSTQTIRALTEAELNDESQEKWFAIQLVVSDQPVNLDAMPHLDIFEAYRLYSIATAGSGKITHSLRIGFFREQVSAEAVSGYLKTFFPAPTIVRISVAEQTRFKDPPARPTSATAPDNSRDGKVVTLSDARARNDRSVIPTVTMEVPTPLTRDPGATGSFKPNATGSFKTGATGTHLAQSAAKGAAPAVKRSQPLAPNKLATSKKKATGKHPALAKKDLSQQLLDEARNVELSESAVRRLPKGGSLLARLVGKLSK